MDQSIRHRSASKLEFDIHTIRKHDPWKTLHISGLCIDIGGKGRQQWYNELRIIKRVLFIYNSSADFVLFATY
jgi:hypothetical protein